MCTASLEKGYYWNSAKKTTPSQKKQVRFAFAMKLPLFGCQKVCDDDVENNAISREYEAEMMVAAMRQQEQSTRGAPHSPNAAAVNHGGGGMRRVKSANASRPRGAVGGAESGMNNAFPKSRSHSQESRSRNAVYEEVVAPPAPPSEQLPIPQCKNKLLEIARKNSDQTDLRRMYDYATWNMYDRIVSARHKKRMSEQDQDDMDEPGTLINQGSSSSSSASKNTDKTSPTVSTTATTSCNSSLTSSPNLAAIACKGSGILKTSGNNNKTTATTIKKVQASASSNTSNTTSASATTTTTVTQAMSTACLNQQQQAATTNPYATQTSSLHYKLRSIKKSFSSHDTDSSQGGTAATTESTSTESSEDSQSGCNSPATFPGCMMASGRSHEHRTLSQGSEDDHFIFQMDM
jgi:hypothetical protein